MTDEKATPLKEEKKIKLSSLEGIKESSDGLMGEIRQELAEATASFNKNDAQLLKFHGTYQQDDRDVRNELRKKGEELRYIMMIRTKNPGGRMTAEQYLLQDSLADRYGNRTLRITTRQDFQFHEVKKENLKNVIHELNEGLVTTYGACGDVVRNVMCCPVADLDSRYPQGMQDLTLEISDQFLPQTTAYYEIWMDGKKLGQVVDAGHEEPMYGPTYLPRKFKLGVGMPFDNCIDIYTQDIGVEVVAEGKEMVGFNLLVGGGLGSTHNRPQTYPRLGDRFGFVTPDRLMQVLQTIVEFQRDEGGRSDRKRARLKYVMDDWGFENVLKEINRRIGFDLGSPRPATVYQVEDHLGWHSEADGNHWYVGLWIPSGRIQDNGSLPMKSGLREIINEFRPQIRMTPQQNIVLAHIPAEKKDAVAESLEKLGMDSLMSPRNLHRQAMACPALPTCGLALTEAERALPGLLKELEELGYGDEDITIRISGCPNACSRPSTAEIGIMGRVSGAFNFYLGGVQEGTELNALFKEKVPEGELAGEIGRLIDLYRSERNDGEAFGKFCNRLGVEELRRRTEGNHR